MASAVLLCAWLLPAGRSEAGVYDVYSCRVPSGPDAGEPAPLPVAEGGGETPGEWDVESTGKVEYSNSCSGGGALTASLRAGEVHGETDVATWRFTAPEGEIIKEATLWRAGDANGGKGYLYWFAGPEDVPAAEALTSRYSFDGCIYQFGCTEGLGNKGVPLSSENEFEVHSENLGKSHLYINVACSLLTCESSHGDGEGFAAVVYLYASDMQLEEAEAPSVSKVTGSLASGEPLSGEASLRFEAEDEGSGVYQQVVEVDGNEVERSIVDEAEGRCRPVSEAGAAPQAFLYPSPCPATAKAIVTLDTTTLSDGIHQLHVSVTNAAGNSTTVLERQIDVANHTTSPGNGEEQQAEEQPKGEQQQPEEESTGEQTKKTIETGAQAGGSQMLPRGLQAPGGQSLTSQRTPAMPNGSPASAAAKLSAHWAAGAKARLSGASGGRRSRGAGGSSLRVAYGHVETIRGKLTGPGGRPIEGALIEATSRDSYGGAKARAMHPARTGRAGGFELKLAAGSSSSTIELGYAETIGGRAVTTKTLRLAVAAAVKLKVAPRTTAAGQAIRLSGRVLGGPVPHGGKQVVLEARSKGTPWLQFEALHTNRSGRFHARHRFRLPGPIRYQFRALCPREADFPFLAGKSRVVGVWER